MIERSIRQYTVFFHPKNRAAMVFWKKKYLGSIWIDVSGAWNVSYAHRSGYLPTNEVLFLLGYKERGVQ